MADFATLSSYVPLAMTGVSTLLTALVAYIWKSDRSRWDRERQFLEYKIQTEAEKAAARDDDHDTWIKELRTRSHNLANEIQRATADVRIMTRAVGSLENAVKDLSQLVPALKETVAVMAARLEANNRE